MKKIILIKIAYSVVFIMASIPSIYAQDTIPKTIFAGSADLYYKYDFANADNGKTSFTNSHDSFELGMASIEASHKFGKAAVFADLGFGNRAAQFSYNDGNTTFFIKQLNVTYEFTPKFKIIAGSFATHIGYELVDAVDNKNYSMSYAFSYGPFFNTGVKAQYTVGKMSYMIGITNATDFKTAAEAGSKQKTFIGQIAYAGAKTSLYFNLSSGSSNPSSSLNKTQFDFVATNKVNTKLTLGFNGTYSLVSDDFDSSIDGEWFAAVGYLNYAFQKKWSLAYRLEYFDDKDGVVAFAGGANVIGNTLSLNFKEGNFTFIPEIRVDSASEDIFTSGTPTGLNSYVLVATTYTF
ncbi:outer membrane beta-barrel protein [Flavobacterium sp.]|uniref:outer membrane beta-barrel protein n=1 Tax=Flavobacterium sp. TaxID=239 RepID=UPI00375078C3